MPLPDFLPDFLASLSFFAFASLAAATSLTWAPPAAAGPGGACTAVPLAARASVPAELAFAAAVVFRAGVEAVRRVVAVPARRPDVRVAGEEPESAAAIVADMVLAASASDFTAVSIDLVALLMARSALVIALAESVALAVAVLSFSAALVTLVAAAETARGVVALAAAADVRRAVGVVVLAAVARVPLADDPPARVRAVPVPVARLAGADVERAAVVLRVPVDGAVPAPLALAGRRAGFAVAVSVATDLPPITISYGGTHSTTCKVLHIVVI